MKKIFTLLLTILFVIQSAFAQSSKDIVMPMGNGIYIISKTGSTGFVSVGKLRRQVIEIANEYALKKNSIAEVVSVNEISGGLAGKFPSVDLKFRLVANSKILADSNATTISYSAGYSVNGNQTDAQITINKPKQTSVEKFEKLEKLGKLFKDGFLTKEEFELEKKKILAEN